MSVFAVTFDLSRYQDFVVIERLLCRPGYPYPCTAYFAFGKAWNEPVAFAQFLYKQPLDKLILFT